jgi:hypothetical protein
MRMILAARLAEGWAGEPVPGEHALDGDDKIVAAALHGFQEGLGSAPHVLVEQDLALAVEGAEIHGPCVQIDPAAVLVALSVESHGSLLKRLAVTCSQPAYAQWRTRRRGPG